jgi:osmotically-inducible protein OsmY
VRPDSQIKDDVEEELRWERDIDSTDIGVAVKDGVVTLTGFVRSFSQRLQAEESAKGVAGVLGIANDIEVRLPQFNQRPDPEIARDAVEAIQFELPFSSDHVRVVAKGGKVTLEGDLEWNYQRKRAEQAVRRIRGVKTVSNLIKLKPKVAPGAIKQMIEMALKRRAEIDADRITVETDGGEVTLRGTVRSWAERSAAENAAWAAPGVTRVDNRIAVSP